MTSVTKCGHCWNRIYPDSEDNGEELRRITGGLSTRCFGYCEREHPGVIYRRIMEWGTVHQRFIRWRRKGIWEKLLETLIDEPDYEWLMIDASHIKVHPHAAGAKGGNQDMSRTKGGSIPNYIWPWMRMVCQSESLQAAESHLRYQCCKSE